MKLLINKISMYLKGLKFTPRQKQEFITISIDNRFNCKERNTEIQLI